MVFIIRPSSFLRDTQVSQEIAMNTILKMEKLVVMVPKQRVLTILQKSLLFFMTEELQGLLAGKADVPFLWPNMKGSRNTTCS